MARQAGTDLDDVKTSRGGNKEKVTDKIEIHSFKPNTYETHRIFGPTFPYCTYWVKTAKKDGKGFTRFPVDSPSFNPSTQEFDRSKYDPWYELHLKELEDGVKNDDVMIQVQTKYYVLSISRAKQKNEPARRPKNTAEEKKTGFKEKDSDSWTPVVALALPSTPVRKIQGFKGMNVVESKSGTTKAYAVSHEKYGHDVRIKFDDGKNVAPADRYDVQYVEKRSPLSEEELAELKWDLSNLANEATEDEVRRDFEGWAKRMGIKTSKKRKHDVEELDEDLEDEDLDDGDEDEDEAPRGKKKPAKKVAKKAPAKKSSKKSRDEDEDDEDLDDEDEDLDDDEDEDDEPPRRGKKKPVAKKSSKKSRDEEDEDDEDDFDEDDEDLDDEDEEDEDLDDDEDEDDEPPRRGKKVVKKAPAKKAVSKKRARDEEDEDDEDDEDLDDEDEDEEEDERPAKKSKKAPAKKAPAKKVAKKTVKKRSRDEDDEDEDEDD